MNDELKHELLTDYYHNPEKMPTYRALQEIQDLHHKMDFHILDALFLSKFNYVENE